MVDVVAADTDELGVFVENGERHGLALQEIEQRLSARRVATIQALGASIGTTAAVDELIEEVRVSNAFAATVRSALLAFETDDDPEVTVTAPVIDRALADEGPVDVVRVGATYGEVVADIERGDDLAMTAGELDDVRDRLADLDLTRRRLVVDNLDLQQLQTLFHNVHSSGFWSNDWNDEERAHFYQLLRPLGAESIARIANDPVALALIAEEVSTEAYLDLLVGLGVDHSGGRLPSGAEADALLRAHIPTPYLATPVADGRQADGILAVVDETNFDIAYQTYRPETTTPAGWNGFVDRDGRLWVRASQANEGTPIHEAVHHYSRRKLIHTSQPLNEGVTEYFTRLVLAEVDDPLTPVDEAAKVEARRSNIYAGNLRFVRYLVDVVGEDVVAAAYFDGDVDGLEAAFTEATGLSSSHWDSMIARTRDDEWASASLHLFPPSLP